ncbi:hypothetical protein COCNU_scaffold010657G000010 [Cocos nucifera]|nr:hypothetical protein [Cocos nucifera]
MGQTDLLASRWLLSKLMGSGEETDEVVVSSSHLSIWKKQINRNSSSSKWVNRNSSSEACYLSVIREAMFVHKQPFAYDDIFAGASCIMFLVPESIPWEIQRVWLQNLLMSVPFGSSLPLLIAVDDEYKEEAADPSATIIKRLGLYDADKTRIPNQKLAFEDCLIKYLTWSSKLLSWDLAVMEANVMADLQLVTTEFAIWGGLSCLFIGYFHNGFPLSLE